MDQRYAETRDRATPLPARAPGKGAGQIDFAFPFGFGNAARTYPFKGYVQLFSGYGETLIDYNRRQTTFGIGVIVNDRR